MYNPNILEPSQKKKNEHRKEILHMLRFFFWKTTCLDSILNWLTSTGDGDDEFATRR